MIDLIIHLQGFQNMYLANNKVINTKNLNLFSYTLNNKIIEWYSQFDAGNFATWPELHTDFLH